MWMANRLFFLLALPTLCFGHGYLKFPASRNYLANSYYCPQCLNAAPTNPNGESFPNGVHGICGDAFYSAEPRDHEAGGKFWNDGDSQATFTEGQVIELNVIVTAYHKGVFEFSICRIDGTGEEDEAQQLTQECLDEHKLVQANVPQAQVPGDTYYYIGPTSDGLIPGNNWDYTMYYQLPEGLSCDGVSSRCVLQWHWITGNSCNPPNTPPEYGSSYLPTCGPGSAYPEEFWNCADITISPSSGGPLPPQPSPIVDSPSPSPIVVDPPEASPSPSVPEQNPPPSLQPTTPAEAFCASKETFGYYASKESGCKGYYLCDVVGSYYFDCPFGTLFNEKVDYCDWPPNVDCEAPSEESPEVPPSEEPSDAELFCKDILEAGNPFGFYADVAVNCEGYYFCDPYASLYFDCPGGTQFDEQVNYCVSTGVQCVPNASPEPSPEPDTPSSGPATPEEFCDAALSVDGNAYGFYADIASGCEGYYLCDITGSFKFSCPAGTLFNEKVSFCDWAPNVECS